MANKIILKKSSVQSKVPLTTDLEVGEPAINLVDRVLYSKDANDVVFLVKADPLYNTGLQDNLDAKVDIAGDTMTGDLTVQGTVTVDHLQLNTSANNTVGIGEVFWNAAERTYNLGLGNDVVGQGFQEIYHPLVKNNTANTISNGTVVGVTGVDSGYVTIAPYISDGSFSHPTRYWGVATEDITSGSTGFITHFGKVRGIDTSAWSVGNILYASDSVAGMLTNIMPETPSDIVVVGIVTEVSTEGVIEVRHEFAPRASDIPYSNTDSTLISTNIQSALDELDMKKASVDMLTSSINIYPTSASGDFGYYRMVSDIDDPDYNDTAYEFQTGYITTTNQYITGFIADANLFVGNPGVISITTVGNIAKTTGYSNDYAEFFFRLYKRDSGGTETLLLTSSTTGAVNGDINDYRQFSASGLLNDGTFTETDRLVLKLYANMLDDNDSRYKFQLGGSNPIRTLLPVPISVIPSYHADSILVDTTNFVSILDETDDNVQTALENIDLKAAPLASPTFTGEPKAPTAASNSNNTQLATTAFVQTAISNLIDTAPSTLDTLNELAAALGDDPNFSNTVISLIGTKLNSIDFNANNVINLIKTVDGSGSGLDADLLDGHDTEYFVSNTSFISHTANTSNPHGVTATQVGLGNVTNESKATMFASPTFTGIPVSPTAPLGTANTMIATTEFVDTALLAVGGYIGWEVTDNINVKNISSGASLSFEGTSGIDVSLDTSNNILTFSTSIVPSANNADFLDGQHGSYYLDWYNIENKPNPNITINLSGDVTGTANTTLLELANGNISVITTVIDDSHNHVISNVDGLQTALDAKANTTTVLSHTANTSNPHGVTATQVGLGNVTNESKTTMFSSPTFSGITTIKDAAIDTSSTDISTTDQTAIYSFSSLTYRTAKFLIQIHDSTNSQYHSTEIFIIHDGSSVYIIQYGSIYTARELGSFDANIISNILTLYFTASTTSSKNIKTVVNLIKI